MQHNTIRKQARTISGVTPVAAMTRPQPCPGRCVYCPTYLDTPQSYTPFSPAVLRAAGCDYDPEKQVGLRLSTLEQMGHPTEKIELIVMGGTFLSAPVDYQYRFVSGCFQALNEQPAADLAEAQAKNETARRRCVGLCIETRPDYCRPADISRMLEMGTTRVELGVQAIDDGIYRSTGRGHNVQDVVEATCRLKNSGLKVYYHWMPNLPGVSIEQDLAMFGRLFSDERFRPDGLKIYPTMVVEGTQLESWYQQGSYTPYTETELIQLVAELKKLVPEYVRISRVLRDIPSRYISAGPRDSLREAVQAKLAREGSGCRCIRCREYGHRMRQGISAGRPRLKRMDYTASGGREVFLTFEDEAGTLFGLLRLRLQDCALPGAEEWQDTPVAVVRELHVYGTELGLGTRDEISAQHRGLGKKLLAEAETIACGQFGSGGIYVLSGVGARPYYRSQGYRQAGSYMYKDF